MVAVAQPTRRSRRRRDGRDRGRPAGAQWRRGRVSPRDHPRGRARRSRAPHASTRAARAQRRASSRRGTHRYDDPRTPRRTPRARWDAADEAADAARRRRRGPARRARVAQRRGAGAARGRSRTARATAPSRAHPTRSRRARGAGPLVGGARARRATAERAHGETRPAAVRMAACAVEVGRPELAEAHHRTSLADGDASPEIHVLAGRVRAGGGRCAPTRSRPPERALEAAATDHDARRGRTALDLEGRAHSTILGAARPRRQPGTSKSTKRPPRAAPTRSCARSCSSARSSSSPGEPPNRLYEAVDVARDAGALVELGVGPGEPRDRPRDPGRPVAASAALLDDARSPRCRDLHLDELAVPPRAAAARSASYAAARRPRRSSRRPRPLLDTPTSGCTPPRIRGDIALRGGPLRRGGRLVSSGGTDLIRASPGVVPSDAPCWHVWALAAVGRRDDAAPRARRGPRRARPRPLARPPLVVAAAAALLAGDEARHRPCARAAPRDHAARPRHHCGVVGAEILGGPATVRWLREALDIYEAAGAPDIAPIACGTRSGTPADPCRAGGARVRRSRRSSRRAGVTAREADVLRLVGDGLSNAEIAAAPVPLGAHGRDARLVAAHQARRPQPRPAHGPERRSRRLRRRRSLRLGPVVLTDVRDRPRPRCSQHRAHDRHDTASRSAEGRAVLRAAHRRSTRGSMLNYMIDIGHRTGLFTAAAAGRRPARSSPIGPG